jgi:hypothetical protein
MRTVLGLALVVAALYAILLPVTGIPGGAPEQNQNLCGNTPPPGCHGLSGSNTSKATLTIETDTLTLWAGQPDVMVRVNVTGAEQRTGDPIGVLLLTQLVNPVGSMPQDQGWTILEDPKGRSPGYNYARKKAEGTPGDTRADFEWRLQAPSIPGNYTIVPRMQTGTDELDIKPVSRDDPWGLFFHVVPLPRVEDTVPVEAADFVYANTPIVLIFNKEMDRTSVEDAFAITPHVNGTFAWEGTVATYVVDGFLEEATDYTFTLGTTAMDTDGIPLIEPLMINFTTGYGIDVYPPNIVESVASRAPLDAVVRLRFDEPMERRSVENAFSITPGVPGNLSWEGLTLVFTPGVELDYDTLYTVRIATSARDLGGNNMASEWVSTFRTIKDTEPPRVLSWDPAMSATDVSLVANVTLSFTDDVDPASLPGALLTVPPVSWDLVWDGAVVTLAPRHPLEDGTNYTVTVTTNLTDVRGNRLDAPFELVFLTAGTSDRVAPSLINIYPSPGSRLSPDGSVQLTFSEPMNRTSVEAGIMVSPAARGEASWSGDVLSLSFEDLEEGLVYTINLAPTATDLASNPTGVPYVLRYVVAPPAKEEKPFFYVEDWIETWWDLALVVTVIALLGMVVSVHLWMGWRRVALASFSWMEERVRTARYLGEARRLYYGINRQMPHTHAERYGSKVVWYWYPFYCLGGIALLSFIICSATGLVLSLYYVPSTEGEPSAAYESIETIMEDVSFGFMFRALHHWSANLMIASVFLHLLRVYFTGAYRNPRELNWVVGSFLLVLTLAYGYSGYLLPWNDLSYWAGTIGLEMCRTVPLMGDWFAEVIFGGIALGAATLTRMYFLHVLVLPAFTLSLMVIHLIVVYIQGLAEPH